MNSMAVRGILAGITTLDFAYRGMDLYSQLAAFRADDITMDVAEDLAQEIALNFILSRVRLPAKFFDDIFDKIAKRDKRRKKKRDSDCPFNSFDGTTLVATENGLVPIEEIRIGDMVWAYNEANQTKSLQEVTHLIRGEGTKELIDIELSTGEVIVATSNHPFWEVDSREWLEADTLDINSILLNINERFRGQVNVIESYLAHSKSKCN